MSDNIIHLVLARLPDAPAGVKGISLFLVPKYLVNDDGSLGQRNDVKAISLEHKLGIHASPTCVMSYGDNDGAIGYLIGEKHQGLACMFTMMNNARLTVGLQGVAISERAYQQSRQYARERIQGVPAGEKQNNFIIHHPDVRRMLMTMRSLTEAARLMAYTACAEVDLSEADLPEEIQARHKRRLALITPMVKGWCTEIAQEVTSLGVQIHGGMGFIEETGIAQHYRDARILPIYEGTNGIQASDLTGRKLTYDKGLAMSELIEDIRLSLKGIEAMETLSEGQITRFKYSVNLLQETSQALLKCTDKQAIAALSFNYLMQASYVLAGWGMIKAAYQSALRLRIEPEHPFYQAKAASCSFFLDQILPRHFSFADGVLNGAHSTLEMDESLF